MKALIVVDVQNDFIPGGALPVPRGDEVVPVINQLMPKFDLVVATQDWHPQNHLSFASNHPGKEVFETIDLNGIPQTLWPDHCVQGSEGAEFVNGLDLRPVQAIFRKGTDPQVDSYSGFYDNGGRTTGMAGYLRERGVNEICVVGLAGDYCVYYTAKDGLKEGFTTYIIEDATRSLDEENFARIKRELTSAGARIITSKDLE